MKKLILLASVISFSLLANAAIPNLTKSTPLTLSATSEGFSQSGLDELDEEVWINWGTSATTHHTGYAKWRVNITDPAIYTVTLDMKSTNGYCFHVDLVNRSTGESLMYSRVKGGSAITNTALACGKLNMTGCAAGEYDIVLTDTVGWSAGKVRGVTLTYAGGAPISIPATLMPEDVMLSSRAWVDKTGAVDSILFTPRGSEGHNTEEWAKWRVKVTKGGMYNFTANTYREDGSQKYEIVVLNSDESSELISNTNTDMPTGSASISTGNVELAAGNYVVRVRNIYNYARSRVLNVVATYEGGATIEVPATLEPEDVILSTRAWVDKTGAVDSILFTPRGSEGHNTEEWVKWKVKVTKAGLYNFTANTCRPDHSQIFEITLLNSNESSVLITNDNGGESIGSGNASISTGKVNLAVGNYVVRVRNIYNHAPSRLLNVVATYEGGATIEVPETLEPEDAIKTSRGYVDGEGYLRFTNDDQTGYILQDSAKWKISITTAGNYSFTVNATSANGHSYTMTLRNSNETLIVDSLSKKGSYGTALSYTMNVSSLEAGIYVLTIRNTIEYSKGRIQNIVVAYAGGAVVDVPATLLPADAILSDSAGIVSGTPDVIDFKVKSGSSRAFNSLDWAKWKIRVTEKSSYVFTANVTSTTGQYYTLSVLNRNETVTLTEKAITSNMGTGEKSLTTTAVVLAPGEYVVKIVNTYPWSDGRVKNIVAAEATPISIADTETDVDAVIGANNGETVDAQLTRSFVGGMYNTVCLPFAVSAAEKTRVFGAAMLLELNDATVENNVLILNFVKVNEMAAGKPYIISPLANITNPKFVGVTIDEDVHNIEFTNVDFVGTFVQTTIAANPNNLFLGSGNTLYFPTDSKTVKGMRGWFEVHNVSQNNVIQRARIVESGNIVTEVEMIDGEWIFNGTLQNCTLKTVENGQVVIIRDGIRYNALGQKMK